MNTKAKIPLICVAIQYKHATQNTMYPFKAMSLSRSLSLQYNCTLRMGSSGWHCLVMLWEAIFFVKNLWDTILIPFSKYAFNFLQSISLKEEMIATISMEGVHVEMHVIRLTFDYVKRDRRERAYIMEDLNSAEVRVIKGQTYFSKLKVSFQSRFILYLNFYFFRSFRSLRDLLDLPWRQI